MTRWRWWAWLRSFAGRYFWLPCPLCRKPFAGYESAADGLMADWYSQTLVCKNCGPAAQRLNAIWVGLHAPPTITLP
jgi:hypothetical protein